MSIVEDLDSRSHSREAGVRSDAAIGHLLRCWVRERAIPEPEDGTLRLVLTTADVEIHAPVRYWSPVGWHRFGPARIVDGHSPTHNRVTDPDAATDAADPGTLAALLAIEAGSDDPDAVADLVARVTDSVASTARFVAERQARPMDPAGTTPFLGSEHALITGHPLHPAPKCRDGLTDAQLAAYSPELRGSFQLHWFAADPGIVSADSALPDSAERLITALTWTQLCVPAGMVPIPAHPWQAQDLLGRDGIRRLLDSGLLRDLGPGGEPWYPTSSLRTVYRADSALMLKLSLGLRIDNSRRENPREELRRGVEVHRLLEAGLGAELAATHPGFAIVRDPAWLAVDLPDRDEPDAGLDVVLRENPFGPKDLAHCVAGLVAERPGAGPSLLACLVRGLAVRSQRPVSEVAREWFDRYLKAVAIPILWLYAEHGIGLEAHQQNTLVTVNAGGWPVGGRYRGNQGYYFAASRAEALARRQPGVGRESDSIVEDAIVDERLGYHLGVNNLLGLIGAFGSQGLADERTLLADLRTALEAFASRDGHVPAVVHALLDGNTLRCEANLLATRSAYAEIPNPLYDLDVFGRA